MKRIALALVLASFAACSTTSMSDPEPAIPAVKPTGTAVLVVSRDGRELGTIRIPAGQLGTLVATDAPGAAELAEQWTRIEKMGGVGIDSHTNDHGKRVYSTRLYHPDSPTFWDAMVTYLKYERGYDVAMTKTN